MKKTYFILSALLAICFLFTVESLQAQASVVSYETPQIYTYGTAIASLVPTLSGGPAEYYMVSPALPQGLNFNISTGVISGTPSIPKSAANYTVTAVNTLDGDGTFVVNIRVNKATQAIVFQALPNPKYGDTSFEALASGGGSGNPVTLTSSNDLIATCSGTTISVVGAGSCTIYADQVGNGNYAAAAQKEQTLTITKSPLTISDVTSPDKVYDGTFAATLIGGTLNGIINSENVVLVPGTGQFADANAESNKTITASGYSIEGTAAGNYSLSAQPTGITASITKIPLTITAEDKTKPYDGNPYSPFTVAYTGFVHGDTSSALTGDLSTTGTAATAVNAGTGYVITPSGLTSDNYAISFVDGSLAITKIPLTIIAEDKTKSYDGNPYSPFTVAYTGFVHGDTSSTLTGDLSTTGTAATAVNAGTGYVITPSGLTSDNYAISFVDGSLVITKIPLTITAEDKTKPYDGNPYSPFTVAYTGFVHGDTSSALTGDLSTTGTAATAVNAGTGYVITPSGLTSDNYAISFVDGSLDITKRQQTITFSSLAAKTYGDAGFELTATASSNSDITYTSDNTAVATILGGTATITGAGSANITASHAGDMNNAPAHETQSLVVSRKMLTISGVISVDKTYDGTLDAKLSGGTLNGVINSDNVTIIPGTGQFADANVGSDKPVTASGYSLGGINAGNYSLLAQPTGITANITDVTYAVTFNTPANGTLIVLNGLNPVNSGDLVMNGTVLTITALPGNGFKLVSLKANNNTISNGDFVTITNVTAISALFDLETNTDIQTSVELKIYPTITTDKVQLHFAEASKVEVVNLTGEVLQSKNLDNLSELTLSLQGYPQGMYFVKVIMKNGEKIVKSVVLHS